MKSGWLSTRAFRVLCAVCVKFPLPMVVNPARVAEPAGQTQAPPAAPKPTRGRFLRAALPLAIGAAIALAPAPHGLALNAWRYFALFAAVMVGIITEPIPAAALGLIGVIAAAALGLV